MTTLNNRIVLASRPQGGISPANFRLEAGGVTKWGESSMKNYDEYIDFLVKTGIVKQKVPATDLVTNEFIAEVNNFDPAEIAAKAKAYKP